MTLVSGRWDGEGSTLAVVRESHMLIAMREGSGEMIGKVCLKPVKRAIEDDIFRGQFGNLDSGVYFMDVLNRRVILTRHNDPIFWAEIPIFLLWV